jgi:predicted RNA-binding Zn-ribbon protein involved in translation (DUF1610 family)
MKNNDKKGFFGGLFRSKEKPEETEPEEAKETSEAAEQSTPMKTMGKEKNKKEQKTEAAPEPDEADNKESPPADDAKPAETALTVDEQPDQESESEGEDEPNLDLDIVIPEGGTSEHIELEPAVPVNADADTDDSDEETVTAPVPGATTVTAEDEPVLVSAESEESEKNEAPPHAAASFQSGPEYSRDTMPVREEEIPDEVHITGEAIVIEGGSTGINDLPFLESAQDAERMGLDVQAIALGKFIQTCQTPMFAAIQGDRGSGKTSLMELMDVKMDKSSVITSWFCAADYASFGYREQLPFFLIRQLLRELLSAGFEGDRSGLAAKAERALTLAKQISDKAVRVTGMLAIQGGGGSSEGAVAPPEVVEEVIELKHLLKQIVSGSLKSRDKSMLVILTDDLDKLDAASAVYFMEICRVFLQFDTCALVAACSFDTIKQGLSARIRSDDLETEARSFFDRLFQVSFCVTPTSLDLREYARFMLQHLGYLEDDDDDTDIDHFIGLLHYSVGPNPRKLKRLTNNLALVDLIPLAKATADEEPEEEDEDEEDERFLHQKAILFAVGCLEIAYPRLFKILMNKATDPVSLIDFMDTLLVNEHRIDNISEKLNLFVGKDRPRQIDQLTRFMQVFRGIPEIGEDDRIDIEDIEEIRKAVRDMSATSVFLPRVSGDLKKREAVELFAAKTREGLRETEGSPELFNRIALGGNDTSYFHLWYASKKDRAAWGLERLSYFIKIDHANFDELTIGLLYNVDLLKKKGVTEDKITKLDKIPYFEEKGFTRKSYGINRVEHGKYLLEIGCDAVEDFNPDHAAKVVNELSNLITETHNRVDSALVSYTLKPSHVKVRSNVNYPCPKCGKTAMKEKSRHTNQGIVRFQCTNCGQKAKRKIE